jgi:hypothetical protein
MKALILSLSVFLAACGGGSEPEIIQCDPDEKACVSSLPFTFTTESGILVFADTADSEQVAQITGHINVNRK